MRELLIVDGYNIINAWSKEKGFDGRDFDMARERLCTLLSSCAGYWGSELIIVYDAALVEGGIEHWETVSPSVSVVFSAAGVSADSVIERLVAEASGVQVIIATSDAAEQSYAFGKGAMRWSAPELLRRVRAAQRDMDEKKDHGLASLRLHDRLPPDVKEAFNTLRLGPFPNERQTKQGASKSQRGSER